jgi:hypothetical protein
MGLSRLITMKTGGGSYIDRGPMLSF